jgi:Concanavalin A-like lectin/glucanases superfamily/Secretion system C-terminal sorting domain
MEFFNLNSIMINLSNMRNKKLLFTAMASIGMMSASMAQTVPSYVPTVGLQLWMPFNGNANDESGNNNNGTVNGASLATDRNGNANSAYSFDGSSNSITILDSDSLSFPNNNFTFSFWLNWNASSTQELAILGKRGSQTANFEYYIEKFSTTLTEPNCIYPHTWNLGGTNVYGYPAIQANSSNGGVWEHFVIVADGVECKVYKNGVFLFTSTTPTINMGNSVGNLTIGSGGGWGTTKWMDGILDDIGIWNRALTQAEITDLYNNIQVGIEQNSERNLISVFPNPANSQVTLKVNQQLQVSSYTMFDVVGKPVLSGKIATCQTVIDLEHLAKGIYLMRVGVEMKHTIRIVKE